MYFLNAGMCFPLWLFSTDKKNYIELLPDELLVNIFSNINNIQEHATCRLINRKFNKILLCTGQKLI